MALLLELPGKAFLPPLGGLPPGQGKLRTGGLLGGEPKPMVEMVLKAIE